MADQAGAVVVAAAMAVVGATKGATAPKYRASAAGPPLPQRGSWPREHGRQQTPPQTQAAAETAQPPGGRAGVRSIQGHPSAFLRTIFSPWGAHTMINMIKLEWASTPSASFLPSNC